MKTISVLVSSAVAAVALLGGTLAYQASSAPDATVHQNATSPVAPTADRQHRRPPKVRWAPCKPPAKRQGTACVTQKVSTVVVPAPAPAPAPPPATRPVRATQVEHVVHEDRGERGESGEDDEHEHESEDD